MHKQIRMKNAMNKNLIPLFVATALMLPGSATPQQAGTGEKGGKTFSIAVIPDTQYNTEESKGGTNALFETQIE